mgnify:CR=1 FL=1
MFVIAFTTHITHKEQYFKWFYVSTGSNHIDGNRDAWIKVNTKIIQNAIKMPLVTIANNAGYEGNLIAAKLLEENNTEKGFNAANGNYVHLKESGIVDPTKVVRTALVHSGSVASLMLTTECMIFD